MNKKIITFLFLFMFQGMITNLGHPVTPAYISSLNIGEFMFGIFLATMSLGMMLGAPFWGNLGDSRNKKYIISLGLMFYLIGQVLFGLFNNQWLLLIARLLSGLGISASITLITSELIISSEKKFRARNIAYLSASVTIGGSIGYYLGGLINTNPYFINTFNTHLYENVFYIQALFTGVFIVLIMLFFNSKKVIEENVVNKRTYFWEGFSKIKYLQKDLIIFLLALVLINVAAMSVDKFIDQYFHLVNYTSGDIGTYKLVIGFVSLFTSIILVPVISRRSKNHLKLMALLQVLSGIIVIVTFNISNFLLAVYTILMIYIIIKAVFQPIEQTYISSYANEDNIGMITGVRQAFLSIGTIIGQLFGAFLVDYNPRLFFTISGILFIVSVGLIFISYKLKNKIALQLKA